MYRIIGPNGTVTFSRHWVILIVILAVWESIWRLFAFWKAARNKQLGWFIVMAVINTAGILEIIYIFFFQAKHPKKDPKA